MEVRCDPSLERVILWHEGAHVYLFFAGYPASTFRQSAMPNIQRSRLLGQPVDFIAEYYAMKLELEKGFSSNNERVSEIARRLDDATSRVPIRGSRMNAQPGAGQLALQAAVCIPNAREYNLPVAREAETIMNGSLPEVKTIYDQATAALQQAPSLPAEGHKFTGSEISKIKQLLEGPWNNIYRDVYNIQFL